MVTAVGASPFIAPVGNGSSVAALQAQLDRCQQQLSDNVNCDSANTREGRQSIQEISGRISDLKARIEKAVAEKPPSRAAVQAVTVSPHTAQSAPTYSSATLGTRLDVFA